MMVWDEFDARAEAVQAVVGGEWLASDTAARLCATEGVQWVISRFGPPTSAGNRDRVLTALTSQWRATGWRPERIATTGDFPGSQLRYPAASTMSDGFFVRFRTNANGSSLQMQTPCTPGDADQLNREKYAEKHTNTPPDIPGASTPSESPAP
jgi:hypothetical protein